MARRCTTRPGSGQRSTPPASTCAATASSPWAAALAAALSLAGAPCHAANLFYRGDGGTASAPCERIDDLRCLRNADFSHITLRPSLSDTVSVLSQQAYQSAQANQSFGQFHVNRQYTNASGQLVVGAFIPADFRQFGTLTTYSTAVGRSTYTVEPGALLSTQQLVIGLAIDGNLGGGDAVIQNGGRVEVAGSLLIGVERLDNPRPISYRLQGGQLSVADIVGVGSTTDFTMTGGVLQLGGSLRGVADVMVAGSNGTQPQIALNAGQQLVATRLQVGTPPGSLGAVTASGTGALVQATTITVGGRLDASNGARVAAREVVLDGGRLTLDGGTLAAATVRLDNGGMLLAQGGQTLNLSELSLISGNGSLGRLAGGAQTRIEVRGGAIGVGGGMSFDGTLDVGSGQFFVVGSGPSQLGRSTTLGPGGSLGSVRFALPGPGDPVLHLERQRTLQSSGDATVVGHFSNHGLVTSQGGTLTFLDGRVDGDGDFAGSIAFEGEYSPGNSPATVSFNGGNVRFGSGSRLTMEVFGDLAGSDHDQLLDIDTLTFDGQLQLVFGAGFSPKPGQQIKLFDARRVLGLDPLHVSAVGLQGWALDLSQLASGRIGLQTVAEPGMLMLLAAAVSGAGLARRRRPASQRSTLLRWLDAAVPK